MPAVTIRNLPVESHRALRGRAAEHGRSTEAELRDILERAARPEGRVKLGSLLASIGREAGACRRRRGGNALAPGQIASGADDF
jgi:plasmid stability protein